MTGSLLAIRIILGSIFLISAIGKLVAPRLFVNNVVKYRVLPVPLAKAYGWVLPFLELGAALILLSGWQAQWGALVIILMATSFFIAVAIVTARHQNLSCGCFGLLYRERVGWPTLVRDAILVAMGIFVFMVDDGTLTISKLISDGASFSSILALTFIGLAFIISLGLAVLSVKPDLLRRRARNS
ncbi:MAG: DoxX family membrane protein [Desulfobacterales bacterium]|nr:DoxX family membrane protein [Desulfobacterales bacterium]